VRKNKKGYSYTLEDEKLRDFQVLTPGERLDWLMKMLRFLKKFMPEKSRITWQKFREGRI
jgi:hypothetical protein